MKKIVVDFPQGMDLQASVPWARGVYTITTDEKNVTNWMKKKGDRTDYIWLGTNPKHADQFNKWNINKYPYQSHKGN